MKLSSALPLVSILALATTHGALTQTRTAVQISRGSGNGTQFANDGGLNEPSSSVTFGPSTASSVLSAGGFVPTLRTVAVNDGTRSQAVAWGVQGYTNTSTIPLDTTLVMSLNAGITGGNDLDARIYLFQDENFEFFSDPGTILFESSSMLWPGFESFANNPGPTGFDILIGNADGPVDEERRFDFTVQPGDSFYVWGILVATADNPGTVDAGSTLTASFTNTSGLTPATIPEPAVPTLGMLGTILLLVRRRERSERALGVRHSSSADGRGESASRFR